MIQFEGDQTAAPLRGENRIQFEGDQTAALNQHKN